jgi:prepilin-type N-terminal cleavage/methylation domain-containing protein
MRLWICHSRAGFTLLEIMVAVAVMAVAFTAVLSLYSRSVSMAGSAQFFIKAPLIAGRVMAEWELARARGEAGPARGDLESFPGYSYDLVDLAAVSEHLEAGDTPGSSDNPVQLVDLTCTVRYQGFTYTARSLRLVTP